MLMKEYRIPLPLTVEEYRIAQLYMIQKKSREESTGTDSGVEILKNEPYENGPGGSGQYTYKLYHVGRHIPSWIRGFFPKTALQVYEEAWNAYPYTKTILKCPFVEKFMIEIDTVYKPDGGVQQNVFGLSPSDLKLRQVDVVDFVADSISSSDYDKLEDPAMYISEKTGRGPLDPSWVADYSQAAKVKDSGKAIMCAYKLCKVHFRYWGMQARVEKFIHDIALRKTMLRAHRQAWAWQDEWFGLTIADIRKLEAKTQAVLAEKLAGPENETEQQLTEDQANDRAQISASLSENQIYEPRLSVSYTDRKRSWEAIPDLDPRITNASSKVSWASLEEESDNDEFFDANEEFSDDSGDTSTPTYTNGDQTDGPGIFSFGTDVNPCPTTILILVVHGGNALLTETDQSPKAKMADLETLCATFEGIARNEFPSLLGSFVVKLVPCPYFQAEALNLLSNIRPAAGDDDPRVFCHAHFPINAVGLLSASSIDYQATLNTMVTRVNKAYDNFLVTPEGQGFCGQVCIIGDSMGSVISYDLLTQCYRLPSSNHSTEETIGTKSQSDLQLNITSKDEAPDLHASLPANGIRRGLISGRLSQGAGQAGSIAEEEQASPRISFDVHHFFMLGSPVGVVLSQRIMANGPDAVMKPHCARVYNLFHSVDPSAARIEPLIDPNFAQVCPVQMGRYSRGRPSPYQQLDESIRLVDYLPKDPPAAKSSCLSVNMNLSRQESGLSLASAVSRDSSVGPFTAGASKWWGPVRLDYCLYSPQGLSSFPTTALPHLMHTSFWDSTDTAFFILKQIMTGDEPLSESPQPEASFTSDHSEDKWLQKRTAIKTKNLHHNHRGNDVIVSEGDEQCLSARFTYGLLDIFSLSGEKVDIYVSDEAGRWGHYGMTVTDKLGHVHYKVPADKAFGLGIHPVKMVVRVDHSYAEFYLLVLPRKTPSVAFSIDGSFTASVSIMGSDAKVRPGSVDVVRYWQSLGYLILYVSARPNLQRRSVVRWLAKHNFPHGPVAMTERISARDPLRQKAQYLKGLVDSEKLDIVSAYGSSKDITVYQSIGLTASRIYAVGKVSRKFNQSAQMITEGYAVHLQEIRQSPKIGPPPENLSSMLLQQASFMIKDYPKLRETTRKKAR